jgi:hypothetical protein
MSQATKVDGPHRSFSDHLTFRLAPTLCFNTFVNAKGEVVLGRFDLKVE